MLLSLEASEAGLGWNCAAKALHSLGLTHLQEVQCGFSLPCQGERLLDQSLLLSY